MVARLNAVLALTVTWHTLFPFRRFNLAGTGYDFRAPKEKRAEPIAKIRAWWNDHRDGGW